jgi:hypothetical protein
MRKKNGGGFFFVFLKAPPPGPLHRRPLPADAALILRGRGKSGAVDRARGGATPHHTSYGGGQSGTESGRTVLVKDENREQRHGHGLCGTYWCGRKVV